MSGLFDFIKSMDAASPQVFTFPNNGVAFDRLPKDVYNKLVSAIDEARGKNVPANSRLVGHLRNEIDFPEGKEIIKDIVLSLAATHAGYFNHFKNHAILTKPGQMVIDPLWINFQSRYEFNPPHGHEGVYSFVIWVKIPYALQDEVDQFPEAKHKMTSMFGFITSDILGRSHINPIPVDQDYEGVICLFPSSLVHYVNPFFTTDQQRISVSGNILIGEK